MRAGSAPVRMPGKNLKLHNRLALLREIALVTRFIEDSRLRDLVESRCRLDAAQVAIMRHLDNQYPFMERHLPIARSGVMRANSGESLQRAEVRRFAERVISRYIPPKTDVAVLFPVRQKNPIPSPRATGNSSRQLPVVPMN